MTEPPRPPDDLNREKAARKFAQWHLGDPKWANAILNAYWNPVEALQRLQEEQTNDPQ